MLHGCRYPTPRQLASQLYVLGGKYAGPRYLCRMCSGRRADYARVIRRARRALDVAQRPWLD